MGSGPALSLVGHRLPIMFNFMCVQTFHMVNIDVPAGVGVPPLDKQLQDYHARLDCTV